MNSQLALGDVFPALKLNVVGGGNLTLPDDIDSDYAMVLFYRGHW